VASRNRRLTRGDEIVQWIEGHCRVPEGALVGQPVVLREWQRGIIRGIYDHDTRRAIVSFGRKNGKTALAAFLLLVHLCGPEARPNSQLYSAAQSREQAAILFALAAKVVRQSPDLSQYVTIRDTAKQLACAEIGTLYRALSAEASTAYGLSPVFVVHDELGQVRGPRSELYDALETASGAQESPLTIVISTQAPTDADLLSVLIDDAKASGDARTRLFLYTADESLDPFSDEAIRQANPAFGDFQNPVEVRDQADAARRMPSAENSYRNLILNQRVNMNSPFVSREVWERNAGEVSDEPFGYGPVYVGLDLSMRNDLTAMVAAAKDGAGVWHVRCQFFTPLNGLEERAKRDRTPYDVWVKQGWMEATPGSTVDYDFVADRLLAWCDAMPVVTVAFDRWRIKEFTACLTRRGRELPMEEFGQGMASMAPALDVVEAELLNDRVRHGGHPVLRMCAANAVVVMDPAGNRKLDKSKATGRIDGLVAMVMALGAAAKQSDDSAAFADFIANPIGR
jgi:phage terminase large subunit-like protein